MRNPNRIYKILRLLEVTWHKVPDMRFGQLIENCKTYAGKDDLFYVEDDEMMQIISNYFDLNLDEENINDKI